MLTAPPTELTKRLPDVSRMNDTSFVEILRTLIHNRYMAVATDTIGVADPVARADYMESLAEISQMILKKL